jgi:hypothetical protein
MLKDDFLLATVLKISTTEMSIPPSKRRMSTHYLLTWWLTISSNMALPLLKGWSQSMERVFLICLRKTNHHTFVFWLVLCCSPITQGSQIHTFFKFCQLQKFAQFSEEIVCLDKTCYEFNLLLDYAVYLLKFMALYT